MKINASLVSCYRSGAQVGSAWAYAGGERIFGRLEAAGGLGGEEEAKGTVVLWRSKMKSVEGESEDLGPRRASRR